MPASVVLTTTDAPDVITSRSESVVDYRLGLNWKVNSDLLAYVATARGTKNGGFDSNIITVQAALQPYDEETITSIEGGIKWDVSPKLRFNGTLFTYDYDKPQIRSSRFFGDQPVSILTNMDGADVNGAELEISWAPTYSWDISWSASLLDSTTRDDNPTNNYLYDNKKLAYAPDFSTALILGYQFQVAEDLFLLLTGSANYVGEHYPTVENVSFEAQSYTIVNARIGLRIEPAGWEVSLWGTNLLDEAYANYAFNHFSSSRVYFISEPMMYGINLKKNF
jgi:iron complex outermembrane receptor protein